jgi:hypothetical protein
MLVTDGNDGLDPSSEKRVEAIVVHTAAMLALAGTRT